MRLRTGGEDHWGCRYCGWAAFADGYDAMDVEGRAALREANPEHPAAPLPEPDRYRSSRTI